jgi:hypothetical protein
LTINPFPLWANPGTLLVIRYRRPVRELSVDLTFSSN